MNWRHSLSCTTFGFFPDGGEGGGGELWPFLSFVAASVGTLALPTAAPGVDFAKHRRHLTLRIGYEDHSSLLFPIN